LKPRVELEEGISKEAIDYAFTRMIDFATVQQGRNLEEQLEAVGIVQSSIGIEEEHRERIGYWMNEALGETSGEVLLGMIVGLYIMQYERDAA
jgi:uncharacterized protein YggL (DUF469 family)